MDEVRVSIIMPVYNEEKYIKYAIDSILAQTYSAWELIIINDASTDQSEEIVKGYNDVRIHYLTYTPNRRRAYALNLGMEKARGEFILAFDADDIACPNMLARQVEYLDGHPKCICVGGTRAFIDENGNVINEKVGIEQKSDIEIRAYELYRNCLTSGGRMYRHSIVKEYGLTYNQEAPVSQDYLFWIDMLPYGEFAYIDEVAYYYRIGHVSQTQKIINDNKEWYDNFMRQIFMYSWSQRGFVLDEADIKFIHDFIFKGKPAWGRHIKQGLCTYNKVVNQSKNLGLKEKTLIVQYYKELWKEGYIRFLRNRIIGILKVKS